MAGWKYHKTREIVSPRITRSQSSPKKTSSETHTPGKLGKLITSTLRAESPSSSYPIQSPLLKKALVNPAKITNPWVVSPIVSTPVVVPPIVVPMAMTWQPETPLRLARPLHDIPVDAPNRLPKFSGTDTLSAKEHIQNFYDALALMDIAIPDVIIRIFVRTFEGEAARWYHLLPNDSIPNWDTMIQEFKKNFQGADDLSSLLRDFMTISIHEGEQIRNFNQCFTSTLNRIPTTSQPSGNNFFHYYMTSMNLNVKYILKDKSIQNLDAAKTSTLEIERNMEESGMIPSPLGKTYFNGRPRNEVPRNEGPWYESPPTQTSRIEERESSETLKLSMNMNNQILSLNRKVNDLEFSAPVRPKPPFPPTPHPRQHVVEVDWCHFFHDFHDPEYCYSYTCHMELSKNDKAPLPPVKNKLSSTSQNDQVNMEDSIPYDDDPLSFGSFFVETRSQTPKTTL
jgi:hypothetical protein